MEISPEPELSRDARLQRAAEIAQGFVNEMNATLRDHDEITYLAAYRRRCRVLGAGRTAIHWN